MGDQQRLVGGDHVDGAREPRQRQGRAQLLHGAIAPRLELAQAFTWGRQKAHSRIGRAERLLAKKDQNAGASMPMPRLYDRGTRRTTSARAMACSAIRDVFASLSCQRSST